MSKTGDTKKRILELLKRKNETLTDISDTLNLAPSTVSQHLQEMIDNGMIKQVDDRPRKWKYYEINRNYAQQVQAQQGFNIRRYAVPLAVVAIAIIAAFALYGTNMQGIQAVQAQQVYLGPNSTVPSGSTVFTVSDAPTLYNISALYVTVENVSIYSATGKWYKIPLQKNVFNLIELKNVSQVLSGIKLENGVYNKIVFQVSNVTATINGTNQSVYLPSNKLTIYGSFNISNSTTSWINIDFNLEHSLHITKDGRIAMLPVLFIRHVNDDSLQLNKDTVVVATAPATVRGLFEYGMNTDGALVPNYTTPQNVSIQQTASGHFLDNGTGPTPIIIRGNHGLFIGGDARNIISISATAADYLNSTTSNISVNESNWSNCTGPLRANSLSPSNALIHSPVCCIIGARYPSSTSNSVQPMVILPRQARCCYESAISLQEGAPQVSVCYPRLLPQPPNGLNTGTGKEQSNAQTLPHRTVTSATVRPGVAINTIAINSGLYASWMLNGGTSAAAVPPLNISVQSGNNSNYTTRCAYQNGALICTAPDGRITTAVREVIGGQSPASVTSIINKAKSVNSVAANNNITTTT